MTDRRGTSRGLLCRWKEEGWNRRERQGGPDKTRQGFSADGGCRSQLGEPGPASFGPGQLGLWPPLPAGSVSVENRVPL